MIVLVTGTPGAGKTFYALRKIAEAASEGKPVATNVELCDDFAEQVARRHPIRRLWPGLRRKRTREVGAATYVASDLGELMALRLKGTGEERGVMVLDESHGWLDSRSWSAGDRKEMVKFFSQHRKIGWRVYLIVQDAEMIDKQVRSLVEIEVRLRNLKNARVYGIPLSPFNCFLAIWTWAGGQKMVMRRELFRLDWRRKLYDTHQLLHGVDDDADGAAIWLPQDGNVAAGRGGTGAPGPATAVSPDPASEGQHAAGVTVAGIAVGPPLLPIPATAITPSFPEPKPTTPRAPHTPGASPTHELPPPPGSLVAAVSDVSSDARASMMAVSPWPMTTERASMGPKRAPGNPGDATARVTSAEG